MAYWLMKSEPGAFSIDDLKKKSSEPWDGVRNYQARNFMKEMKKGDMAFFYHSNANPSGIAGVCKIVKESYPDHTQFDPKSKYYDPKSDPENPRWELVDVKFVKKLKEVIPLQMIKANPKLKNMKVVQKGSRLSITPVTKNEWDEIDKMIKANSF